jgi:chitin disaccharide deacetylase
MKITVNADDFGMSASINQAIIGLFDQKLINSATVMANMPAFDEAIELIHDRKIEKKIGIHLVLTDGESLTKEIKSIEYLFAGKALLKNKFKYNPIFVNRRVRKVIYYEYAAQIEKLISNGIQINHIDTHHHVHEYFLITHIIMDLMKKYSIPSLRILNNTEHSIQPLNTIYRKTFNLYLKIKQVNNSDLFGNHKDIKTHIRNSEGLAGKQIEIMVHPLLSKEGIIVDKISENEINTSFVEELSELSQYLATK